MTIGKLRSATISSWFMALSLSAVLAGCGGDGNGGPTTVAEGQGNFGAKIVGGTVQMACAGNTAGATAITGATGGFTVAAPGSPPCVIKISGGNLTGGPFYSIFEAGQARANVNQLTTMLAFLLADGNPETFFTSPSTISTKITAAAVATDKETIRANVVANLAGAVTPAISTSFDFLRTAFASDSTGFDQMLDKLGFVATGNTAASITFNGSPILAVNPTTDVASTLTSAPFSSVTLAAAGASGTAGAVATATTKAITAFSFVTPAATGTIDETNKNIAVTVPNGTNITTALTTLVATFTTTGAGVMVGTTAQTSAATANDFTSPVAYIVTAADATTATYTVTVTVAPPVGLNLRRTFGFAVLAGTSITNAGTTTVTGNVGASSFAGTAPTVVDGGTFTTGDAAYDDAMADLPSVIADANDIALFPCGPTISGTLSNAVLTPGVTCIAADAAILATGEASLNGAGVYIIRTAGALTPAASSNVVYAGTATDANTTVFWVVGSASLGYRAEWIGTILSGGAIMLGSNPNVYLYRGRVLTTAGVTLTSNTITIP